MTPLHARMETLIRDMQAFLDLLGRESTALAAGDADALSRLGTERQNLSTGIADHWKALAGLLGQAPGSSFATLRDKALTVAGQPGAGESWRKLENLAREASRLNQINSRLIEEQLRRTQVAMQVLQSAAAHRGIYGADGRVSDFLNINRSIDTA